MTPRGIKADTVFDCNVALSGLRHCVLPPFLSVYARAAAGPSPTCTRVCTRIHTRTHARDHMRTRAMCMQSCIITVRPQEERRRKPNARPQPPPRNTHQPDCSDALRAHTLSQEAPAHSSTQHNIYDGTGFQDSSMACGGKGGEACNQRPLVVSAHAPAYVHACAYAGAHTCLSQPSPREVHIKLLLRCWVAHTAQGKVHMITH